ncbi:type VI secretion system baseplate subunit TssG [Phyllobacterium phragmitis]|uniref:Type VI secretion system baseplate subunit TssG n=1 Tax=Phyllobacterium phragmitis TaxID=2670329 RepID=A0A2S9IKW3_9HYPH|nr:type VI secretion system baseplate subunit TssG [Phyllobacterium phragmitis]PRD41148.1 type VI secretion system baseplate subunit TssG [Phyllobacterium phragmitis]
MIKLTIEQKRRSKELASHLEKDPGRFEPTTAFRVAQASCDALQVSSHIGISPAPLPLDGFRRGEGGKAMLRSAFPNLLGPLGALPPSYNELAIREERNRSRGLTAFLDLFGARLTELFVDACEKYRIARLLRWGHGSPRNGFLTALFSLTGFGTARVRETSGVDEALILRFSGFFAARTRNASNLTAMLREFTGLPVKIELFRGRWLTVPLKEQSNMGRHSGTSLGVNAMAGAAIRDFSGGFRVVIGPLDYADYSAFAPGNKAANDLFAVTRLFVGPSLDFDVQIVLKKEQIPFCQLGRPGDATRLGWNSWARIARPARDSGDAIIRQSAAVSSLAS